MQTENELRIFQNDKKHQCATMKNKTKWEQKTGTEMKKMKMK